MSNSAALLTEQNVADAQRSTPCWLRLKKTGSDFDSYYSYSGPDGPWTVIGTTFTNPGFDGSTAADIEIGVFATNTYDGSSPTPATFDDFSYLGASNGNVWQRIPFASSASDFILADGWHIDRRTDNFEISSPTAVAITTAIGNFGGSDSANNILYRIPADENFDISVKTTGVPRMNFQSFMIFARARDDHSRFVGAIRRYHSGLSVNGVNNIFQLFSMGSNPAEQQVADAGYSTTPSCWLRLVKNGTNFAAYYKYHENDDWMAYKTSINNSFDGLAAGELEIGIMATNSDMGAGATDHPVKAAFEDFTYAAASAPSSVIPFAVSESDYVVEVIDTVPILVPLGTATDALGLPDSVPVYTAYGEFIDYSVTWHTDTYHPNDAGTYLLEGVLNDEGKMPNINGLKASVSVTVVPSSITMANENQRVTAEYVIGNAGDQPLYYHALLAVYNKKGQLVDLWRREGFVGVGELNYESLDAELPDGCYMKAFLWDSVFQPLLPAEEMKPVL